jgi:hypothetical protein
MKYEVQIDKLQVAIDHYGILQTFCLAKTTRKTDE